MPASETIDVIEVSGMELYHRYPGQTSRQRAQVVLDCQRRTLSARTDPEIGNARTVAEFHGHIQTWTIPALKSKAANELLEGLAPLAEQICDGYSVKWDGHNEVACFTERAQDAINEIACRCDEDADEDDEIVIWTADQWLGGIGNMFRQAAVIGVTSETTDEEIAKIAERIEAEAKVEGVDGLDGLLQHLETLRVRLQEEEH